MRQNLSLQSERSRWMGHFVLAANTYRTCFSMIFGTDMLWFWETVSVGHCKCIFLETIPTIQESTRFLNFVCNSLLFFSFSFIHSFIFFGGLIDLKSSSLKFLFIFVPTPKEKNFFKQKCNWEKKASQKWMRNNFTCSLFESVQKCENGKSARIYWQRKKPALKSLSMMHRN